MTDAPTPPDPYADDPVMIAAPDLHQAMGALLATWAQLESWLGHILSGLLAGSAEGRLGETILSGVSGVHPRIAIVDAAFFDRRDKVPQDVVDLWAVVSAAIKTESVNRNAVVHGDVVGGAFRDGTGPLAKVISKNFSDRTWAKGADLEDTGYDTEGVWSVRARTAMLRDTLWSLYARIPGVRDSHPPRLGEEYVAAWKAMR